MYTHAYNLSQEMVLWVGVCVCVCVCESVYESVCVSAQIESVHKHLPLK